MIQMPSFGFSIGNRCFQPSVYRHHRLTVTMVDRHLCGWYKIAEHCFVSTVEVDQCQELS